MPDRIQLDDLLQAIGLYDACTAPTIKPQMCSMASGRHFAKRRTIPWPLWHLILDADTGATTASASANGDG